MSSTNDDSHNIPLVPDDPDDSHYVKLEPDDPDDSHYVKLEPEVVETLENHLDKL